MMKGSALGLIDVVQALLYKDANIDIKNKVRKCVKEEDSLWRGFKSLGVTEYDGKQLLSLVLHVHWLPHVFSSLVSDCVTGRSTDIFRFHNYCTFECSPISLPRLCPTSTQYPRTETLH